MLKIEGLSVKIGRKKIVDNVSFDLKEHDIFIVMGPNGAGKTTLLKPLWGQSRIAEKYSLIRPT